MFPKGLGGLGNVGQLMRQALDLKANMERLKEDLAKERVEASAGGGMVTIAMNGKMEVLSVKIDPEVINAAEPEILETLVAAAVNEATRLAQDRVREKMSEITGGLDIPGLTS
jgi:DNA-binding YbaB/EbfC family protein